MDSQQAKSEASTDVRVAFYTAMSGLQSEFINAAIDIDVREKALKAALANVRLTLEEGIGETVLSSSHKIARFMADFNGKLKDIVREWLNQMEKYDRNTAFRKGFTDSLVVFVLGKVKAGKSSLGNYMAYGRSNPEETPVSHDSPSTPFVGTWPHFFTAATASDASNQAEASEGERGFFRVGVRETTKSIQGFRIPGLTWVDSPGLHSVTPENGALASDYADVADLIVYPMHTANPGRAGDLAEIQGLLRSDKRFLVAITQCDRPEEDEAPDGTIVQHWIMKDCAARQGQIDYVRCALSTAGVEAPFDILSLSVRHAETHNNNPKALKESGMADFFSLLTDIARSEGVRCKRGTPSRNLDNFVDRVLDARTHDETLSVACVDAQLSDLNAALAVANKDLDHRARRVISALLSRIGPVVSDQIERHAKNKDQTGFERECALVLRQIVVEEILNEILLLIDVAEGTLVLAPDFAKIVSFLKFESFIVKIPKSNRKTIGAVGKTAGGLAGAWLGGELGFAAGTVVPVIGNVIGGAVGVMLGGLVGAVAGNAAGEALGSDWEEVMQSGDNRAEVEASAVEELQRVGEAAVKEFFLTLKGVAIESVERRAAQLRRTLEQFSEILKTKVRSHG